MKQLLYGVFTTLTLFGVGKVIYDKGRKDENRYIKDYYETIITGMKIQEQSNKGSK